MNMAYRDINLSSLENRSILVIDDNHAIHRDYRAVLCPYEESSGDRELDAMEEVLFGDADAASSATSITRNFHLEPAYQGEEAYLIVKEGLQNGVQYPVAFVDMRMPPGWDGLETIERLREVDPKMRFVIVTAYSDHTYETIIDRIGPGTSVKLLYKPFDPGEMYELAFKELVAWSEAR